MNSSVFRGHFPPARDARCPLDPPPALMHLLREEPISKIELWDGTKAWLITSYVEGHSILADDRFSADPRRPGFPEKSNAYVGTIGKDRNIRVLDNPEHDLQKRMMVRDFTVKRVNEIRPRIEALMDKLLNDILERGPVSDLVEDLAIPLPTMLICELLGVPYEHQEFFGHRTHAMLSAPPDEAANAGREMNEFMEKLVDMKIKSPANDLISRLVHEQMIPGHLTREDLVSTSRLMLLAGHGTTASMISLSALLLIGQPEAARQIRENTDPAFLKNAVEEMLRYLGILHSGRRRIAIEDVHIGDHVIKAGEGVVVMNNVMDRDECVFKDADKFDITRVNAREHTAFGFGIHQCLGQLLARMELQVVHAKLWKRIPTLRLAVPFEELRFSTGVSRYEVIKLPVTWDH